MWRRAAQLTREIATHMTGKWDAGMATPQHTPIGRGYTSWLGYFHHANDYYTEGLPLEATGNIACASTGSGCGDWTTPAKDFQGAACTRKFREPDARRDPAHAAANRRPAAEQQPLFLVHSFHLCHTPLKFLTRTFGTSPTCPTLRAKSTGDDEIHGRRRGRNRRRPRG